MHVYISLILRTWNSGRANACNYANKTADMSIDIKPDQLIKLNLMIIKEARKINAKFSQNFFIPIMS